ncbi:mandelate racemase/muconate lactonizing enzyme family protein [Comamonas endophytica]|uniref:Mandelate racemase/muconate lactonizing enzyme family protein n=1 Tax=Comamonas endophytica TaxID=2949090 RepID=A0ABY6GBZ0_9BURK|nr:MULTISPECIES: mandelate racemase/muconate lactonizing enzyme family protein [unclassified Acidovorax]MCD2512211.1 mandelate racemase/muconate lactonizing enzyme family protein [Acidovorax sp. D4N7]UYG51979.1 mandelate racemase/muconate lactonizing enzyme family protein [Acidovorax sp. 5MLIR]
MSSNTIASVTCIPMRLPFHHWSDPPLFAGRPRNKLDSALVRVETEDGTVAWGESYCVEPRALQAIFETLIAPLACGRRADDVALLPSMQRTLHNLGRSGPVVHALAGLDIALWDLRAKRAGVPLHELLGGKRRDRVRVYASLLQYYADATLLEQVSQRALAEGYTEIKLHERTAPALAAVRRAVGPDIPVMVDTNCAWLPHEAEAAITEMLPYEPFWIEEPIWPPENDHALAELRQRVPVPLAVGENASCALALQRMVESACVQYVQPSVIKLGLTAAWDIARACEGTGVTCAPQVAFFGPGFLASLHLIAAQQAEVSIERLYVELAHVPYGRSVPIERGWLQVPDGPGLGADPEAALAQGNFAH